jgi:hypothetical protein
MSHAHRAEIVQRESVAASAEPGHLSMRDRCRCGAVREGSVRNGRVIWSRWLETTAAAINEARGGGR